MGESGLELKNTAIKVQNLFPFLECFKSPVSHGQSLWQSTIFGCLCSRHRDILDLPGIFSSFLKKLLRSSGKHIFSLFSTEFWFLFLKDTLLPRETGNFKLKYSSIFEKTLCTYLFEPGSQFQHHRFSSVAVSTLPIFGEMSLQYFQESHLWGVLVCIRHNQNQQYSPAYPRMPPCAQPSLRACRCSPPRVRPVCYNGCCTPIPPRRLL